MVAFGRCQAPVAAIAAAILGAACGTESVAPGPVDVEPRPARCFQEFGEPDSSAFVLPFGVGKTQRLIQGYCPTNPTWGHYNWLSYDFDTQIGDTITASRGGQVLFVRESFDDGTRVCGQENFVFIEHEDGTVMHYVHLTRDGALVEVGDSVEQGDPIGLSGDSGCSSGPHVHVTLFRDRSSFDKENSLPLNYRDADGPLDSLGGLVQGAEYTHLAPASTTPGG